MTASNEEKRSIKGFSVGIIGAGISGIVTTIRLKEIGFENVTIYERDVDVGGTWLTNTYPGCRCDVAAHLYSLSTHPNPNWTEAHPPQAEILEYWKAIARKEGVYSKTKFLTSFVSGQWDSEAGEWVLKLKPTSKRSTFGGHAKDSLSPSSNTFSNRSQVDGAEGSEEEDQTFEQRHTILISGTGGFSWPLIPNIKGLKNPYVHDEMPKSLFNVHEQTHVPLAEGKEWNAPPTEKHLEKNDDKEEEEFFEGLVIHPSRWPRKELDLKGKKVAVLGNGCSAAQIVPAISEDKEVKVWNFIRSGQWFLPRTMKKYSTLTKLLFRVIPGLLKLYRWSMFVKQDLVWYAFELQNKWIRDIIEKESKKHIKKAAPEEAVDMLTPKFPFGGKRTVFDAGYTAALRQENVTAVSSPISRFNKRGIVTADGKEYPLDVAVIATGYDVTAAVLNVTGKYGTKISDGLTDMSGPQAYHGMLYPGFPNFYVLLGHNVAPGHTSVVINIETQARYIAQIVEAQLKNKVRVLEAKQEPTDRYMAWLDRRLENTTWSQATSFYRLGQDRKGRVFTNWPAYTSLYSYQNRKPIWEELAGAEKMAIRSKVEKQKRLRLIVVAIVCFAVLGYFRRR